MGAAIPIYHTGRTVHMSDARRRSMYALLSMNHVMIYHHQQCGNLKSFHSIHPLLYEIVCEIFFFLSHV